ncbi:MAG: zf-HC2 domain-containing protein [Candidatus Eremiobacteraeota bacterium]|nr:zf-HC2 domain-containing protein [Candidatus Eremiobacteraeota bacterium]
MNQQHASLDQLVDYIHGELAPAEDASVHSHLAECAQCAQAYDREVSLTSRLREIARSQERELPEGYASAIRRASAAEAPRAWPWQMPRLLRPLVAVPAALVVAAVLYFGITTSHTGFSGAQRIDALSYVHHHTAVTAAAPFSDDTPIPAMLTDATP